MKKLHCALAFSVFSAMLSISQSGCGGSNEVAPPETAPSMSEEEQKNYESQMEKMKEYQKNMGKK